MNGPTPSGSPRLFLSVVAAALLFAAVGQVALTGLPGVPALSRLLGSPPRFLLAACALLLAVFLGTLAAGSGRAPGLTRPLKERLSGRERLGLALGAGLALAADLVFLVSGETVAVRLFWAGALMALLVFLRPARHTGGEGKPWLLVALLTALAFVLRYHDLTNLPADLDGDFASIGLDALGMMTAPVLKMVGVGWGELTGPYYATFAATMALFGADMHGLMINGALAGAATVPAVFLMAREAFGTRAGLLAAALLATSTTHLHFSRVFATTSATLAVTLLVFSLIRGLKRGEPFWFALGGLSAAASLLLYFAGRVGLIAVFALAVGGVLFERRAALTQWRNVGVFVLALVIGYGPMAVFSVREGSTFLGRAKAVTLFNPDNMRHEKSAYGVTTAGEVIVEQAKRTLLTCHLFGDTSAQYGSPDPMVDPVTAALLVVAIGVSLRRLRAPARLATLGWIGTTALLGGVMTLDPPSWVHLGIALPAIYALVAALLDEVLSRIEDWLPRGIRPLPQAAAVLLLALVAVRSVRQYVAFASTRIGPRTAVTRWISSLPTGMPVLLHYPNILWFRDREFAFYNRGVNGRDVSEEELRGDSLRPPFAVAIRPDRQDIAEMILARHPDARRASIRGESSPNGYAVIVGRVDAPAYGTLGKTSAAGWVSGLILVALVALRALRPRRQRTSGRRPAPGGDRSGSPSEDVVAGTA